jgi:hypothetical protein
MNRFYKINVIDNLIENGINNYIEHWCCNKCLKDIERDIKFNKISENFVIENYNEF